MHLHQCLTLPAPITFSTQTGILYTYSCGTFLAQNIHCYSKSSYLCSNIFIVDSPCLSHHEIKERVSGLFHLHSYLLFQNRVYISFATILQGLHSYMFARNLQKFATQTLKATNVTETTDYSKFYK